MSNCTPYGIPSRLCDRRGGIAVMTAVLLVPLLGMLAFAIDYGYLLRKRAELQRAADASVLAAVRDLLPDADGVQDMDKVRDTLREYAASNVTDVSGFTVIDEDIEIGRYDPTTVYTDFTILNDGVFDTVRVTLRRDGQANSPVSLFFSRVLGISESDVAVTATAVLQKASFLGPGSGVLPFTIPEDEWNAAAEGDEWSIYGEGHVTDGNGNTIPGNFGTCDIGSKTNSTSDMRDQILEGLRQKDLDALHSDGRIPQNTHIDSTKDFMANGDPGLSAGMKSAVQAVHGQVRLIPLVDSVSGKGANVEYHVTGWAVCKLIDSTWNGSKKTKVNIKKTRTFDGLLKPNPDLSATSGFIEGAFTSPALVQ